MSLYSEKEANLAKAFTHLVQDSSDDEEVEEKKIVPQSKSKLTAAGNSGSGKSQDETTASNACETSLNSDRTDCIIEEISISEDDEEVDDDVVEILNYSQTKRKTYQITPEKRSPIVKSQQSDHSISLNDDYEFNLKVIYAGKYKQYSTTYLTKLSVALRELIEELEKKGKSVVLTDKDNEPFSLDESPQSLNLTPGSLLHAIEIAPTSVPDPAGSQSVEEHDVIDPDIIRLKLQDGHRKHVKQYDINKNDPVIKLKEFWSKEYNIDAASIRLCFDGDILSDDSTPEEFDIEDGCVIDVMVAQPK